MALEFERLARSLTAEGENQKLPGFAVVVADDAGNIRYSNAFGSSPAGPVTVDTTMWVASCTKLMTTIAVLQCVEKGLIDLDEDIGRILPEYAEPDLLYEFDEKTEQPKFRKAKKKITMRHLLTHSSGLAYDAFEPALMRLQQVRNQKTSTLDGDMSKLVFPLVFEPGEGFAYGVGIDWAGKAVERVNGNIRLGDYMKKHIWEPLGMTKTTFRLDENEAVRNSLAKMSLKTPEGKVVASPTAGWTKKPVDDIGGAGSYSCASDYIKMLISILKNDGKLLKPETVETMFQPHLEDRSHLRRVLSFPEIYAGFSSGLPAAKEFDWGLGGALAMEETPGQRSRGTLTWGGLPNLYWWIDRQRGTCGILAMQLLPFFDPDAISLYSELEKMVWKEFAKPESKI
ncbi:hypothetical protein VTO42DRAFT_7022 [Malbranchea cinnamomea]